MNSIILNTKRRMRAKRSQLATDKQQLKAKMPAAGATQALRLFNNTLVAIFKSHFAPKTRNEVPNNISKKKNE